MGGGSVKRRAPTHACPVCGKHYVNEGSLRKHLAAHPETAHITSALRMWPCSICPAVFPHETGILITFHYRHHHRYHFHRYGPLRSTPERKTLITFTPTTTTATTATTTPTTNQFITLIYNKLI